MRGEVGGHPGGGKVRSNFIVRTAKQVPDVPHNPQGRENQRKKSNLGHKGTKLGPLGADHNRTKVLDQKCARGRVGSLPKRRSRADSYATQGKSEHDIEGWVTSGQTIDREVGNREMDPSFGIRATGPRGSERWRQNVKSEGGLRPLKGPSRDRERKGLL